MTVKEIAKAVGKPVRTVQDWVKSLSAKSASISAKSALSSPMKPADYTLSETCDIIEAGLGKAAADVYRTNAVNAECKNKVKQYSAAYIREIRLTLGKDVAASMLTVVIKEQSNAALITDGTEKLPDHIARQVYAVALKAWGKEQEKLESSKNKTLFD